MFLNVSTASNFQPASIALFVPCLVTALLSPVMAVRTAALQCASAISTVDQELLSLPESVPEIDPNSVESLLYTSLAHVHPMSSSQVFLYWGGYNGS